MRDSIHFAPDGPVKVGSSASVVGGRYWLVELADGQTITLEPDGDRWTGQRYQGGSVVDEARTASPSALVAALTGRRSSKEEWIRELEAELLAMVELESRDLGEAEAAAAALTGIREWARKRTEANAAILAEEDGGEG